MSRSAAAEASSSLHFFLAARRSELHGLEHLQAVCELVNNVCQLVHVLQKERGYSNLYLSRRHQPHHPLLGELQEQSQHKDLLLRRLLERMDRELTEGADRARLLNCIACALYRLEGLQQLRWQIRECRTSADEASREFTRLIGSLLSVVFEAADSALDADITRCLVALFNFMQGKELSGQERALGVMGYMTGNFNQDFQQQLQTLTDAQTRSFALFSQHAPTSVLPVWDDVQHYTDQVQRLRAIALNTRPGDLLDHGLAEVWFELCTLRIDAMHKVEHALASHIEVQCRQKIDAARLEMDNHQLQLHRLKDKVDTHGDSARIFNIQVRPLDVPVQDGMTRKLERSMLDILQEQQLLIQTRDDALAQAKRALDERKDIEKAKWLLVKHHHLTESAAHDRLQRAAMENGILLADVAHQFLKQLAKPKGPDKQVKL